MTVLLLFYIFVGALMFVSIAREGARPWMALQCVVLWLPAMLIIALLPDREGR